jgi:hypothetical protein
MKRLFTLALALTIGVAVPQSATEKKVKEAVWGNPSKEFKSTAVPEKWKNESAVILATAFQYTGDFSVRVTTRNYATYVNRHTRLKLQDNAAVKEFSEFEFDNQTVRANIFGRSSAYSLMGIKVIKPNGSEKEIDLSEAVKAEFSSDNDLKIPIANLEVGDIIDYFTEFKLEELYPSKFGLYELLGSRYPTVWNTIIFKMPREMSFTTTSFNGAPEFKRTTENRDVIYTLVDEMREKNVSARWLYPYRTSPHVRMAFKPNDYGKTIESTARDAVDSFFGTYRIDIGLLEDYINLNFKKERDQKKIVRELYELMRNPLYMEALFNIPQGEPLNQDGIPDLFFYLMATTLKEYKIAFDMLIVPTRQYGPLKTYVSLGPCDFMMRVNTTPPIYISRPTPFKTLNMYSSSFEGMDYVTDKGSSSEPLPFSKMEANSTTTSLTIALNKADLTRSNFKRRVKTTGYLKAYDQYLVFTNYDYLVAYDLPKYQTQSSVKMKGLLKKYNTEKAKLQQRQVQDYEERDKRLKEEIESEFDGKVTDYKNLKVENIGMWVDKPDLEFSDEFSLDNLVKKAGPNLIVELGRVIEKQVEIKEEDLERKVDIYQDFARSINQEISFTIPDGYTAEGIDNFKYNIENETGGFTSTVEQAGNVVTIKVKKFYKASIFKAEDWPKIVEFLKAASAFHGQKLLLKKGV